MEVDRSILQMEMFIVDNIKMVDSMALVDINGNQREPSMKEILKMGWDMEKENGNEARQNIVEDIVRD